MGWPQLLQSAVFAVLHALQRSVDRADLGASMLVEACQELGEGFLLTFFDQLGLDVFVQPAQVVLDFRDLREQPAPLLQQRAAQVRQMALRSPAAWATCSQR